MRTKGVTALKRALLGLLLGTAVAVALLVAVPLFAVLTAAQLIIFASVSAFGCLLLALGVSLVKYSPLAAAVPVAVMSMLAYVLFGLPVAVIAAFVMLLPLTATVMAFRKQMPFFQAAIVSAGATLFALLGAYMAVTAAYGDPVTLLMDACRRNTLGSPDAMAAAARMLESMGAGGTQDLTGLFISTLAVRQEALRFEVPALLMTMALNAGLLGCLIPNALAIRGGKNSLVMPPLEVWRMPRWMTLGLSGMYVILYVLAYISSEVFYAPHRAIVSVFQFAFAVQGIATAEYLLKKRGTSRGARVALEFAVYFLFPQAATILGVIDWLIPIRRALWKIPEPPDEGQGTE